MPIFYGETKEKFEDSFRVLLRGIILFGSFMVMLGLLIFVFPILIGFLFVGFILFAGVASLYAGYKVWKLRKNTLEYKPAFSHMHFERPFYRRTHMFIIR